jgi:hypothetical protein
MMKTLSKVDDATIRANLRYWYDQATLQDVKDAMKWYKDANRFCKRVGKQYDISPYTVASVVSALSPRNRWEQNKVDAQHLIEAFTKGLTSEDIKVCTFNKNKTRAFDILENGFDIPINSIKTHSFAMNVGLLSKDHITLDSWMARACLSRTADECLAVTFTDVQYRRVEAIVAEMAHEQGLTGYQYQSVIWIAVRKYWRS